VPATSLKVMGVELFTAGVSSATEEGDEEVLFMDTRSGVYRKTVLRDGRLAGAILLGDLSLSPELGRLIRSDEVVPEELLSGATPERTADDADLVCSCNAVNRGTILAIARDRGLERVEQVTTATRAGSGCGSCVPLLRGLLDELHDERDAGLAEFRERGAAARLGQDIGTISG